MSVSLSLKTLLPAGNIMYARGAVDYSILEMDGGALRYRFNFGSGEGVVTLRAAVNDGKWHEVRLERHDNGAKISLDGGDVEEQGSDSTAKITYGTDFGVIFLPFGRPQPFFSQFQTHSRADRA